MFLVDQIVRNVLSWVTDTASVNKTTAQAKAVGDVTVAQAKRQADAFTTARQITSEYDTVLGKLGATASANLTLLEQKMRDGARETERLKRTTDEAGREVQDLTTLYDALEQQAKEAATAAEGVRSTKPGTTTSINVGQLAGRTAGLGAILGSEAGGSLLPAVAQIIQLTATAGPAGLAVGALAGAARLVTEESQKTTEALKRQGAALLDLQIALPKTTREELQQQLDEAQAALPIAEAFARSASENVVKYVQAHPDFTFPVTGIVAEAVAGLGGTLGGLQGIADDANTTVTDLQGTIANLLIAMAGLPPETTALAEAEERLREVRQLAVQEIAVGQNEYASTFVRAQLLTAEQREEEVRNLEAQKEALESLIASGTQSGDQIAALNNQIDSLDNQIAGLTEAHKTYGDALDFAAKKLERQEQLADSITSQNQQRLDLEWQYVEAREKAVAAEQKILDAQAEEDAAVAKARAEHADRLTAIEQEGGEDRAKILQDSQDRASKIVRDGGQDLENAVFDRDAKAAYLSKQRTANALDDQRLADKRRLDENDKTTRKQLAAEVKTGSERLRAAETSADKTIAAARKERDASIFYAQQTAQSIAFLAGSQTQTVTNYHAKMYNNLNALAYNGAVTIAQSFQNGLNAALGGRAGAGPQRFQTLTDSPEGRALDARMAQIAQQQALNTYARIRVQTRD